MRIYFVNFITPETGTQYNQVFDLEGGEGVDRLISTHNRIAVLNIGKFYYAMHRNSNMGVNGRMDMTAEARGVLVANSVDDYINKIQSACESYNDRPYFSYEFRREWHEPVQRVRRKPMIREFAIERYIKEQAISMHELLSGMANRPCEGMSGTTIKILGRASELLYNRANYGGARRIGASRMAGVISYKGQDYSDLAYGSDLSRFKQIRKTMKLLGEQVRQCIASESTEYLDTFILENFSGRSLTHVDTFEKVRDHLRRKFNIRLQVMRPDCGHFEHSANVHHIQDTSYCEECYDEYAVRCVDDDEMYHCDNVYYWDSDQEYHLTPEPEPEPEDDGEDANSMMDYSTNVLNHLNKDTSFTPSPYGELLMGIELEIGIGDRSQRQAVEGIRSSLGEDYVVCKYDGSLPDDGIEIVTAPRKLDHHIKQFKAWDVPSGYRAWDAKKCGMHIHIDSRGFSRMTLGKFFMFFNADSNADFIRKIAGRHPLHDNQAREYCAAEQQHILVNPSTAVKGKSTERYRIINTQNLSARECKRLGLPETYGRYNTVELRIFRATLNKARLLAQMEFTHAVVMFCRVASWRNLNGDSFVAWLSTTQNVYPHLSDWYGVRRKKAAKPVVPPVQDSCPDATPAPEAVTAEPRDVARARGRL
jgi:hypothetical protein